MMILIMIMTMIARACNRGNSNPVGWITDDDIDHDDDNDCNGFFFNG